MADELTAEEEAKAKELEKKTNAEKTTLEKIGDDVNGITDMLKSQTVTEKEPEEKATIDVDTMTIEDMAKAINDSDDPEGQIKELIAQCNVGLENLIDTDGERHFDDEMLKSLQDSDEETKMVLNGIILAGKSQADRTAKAIGVMSNLAIGMTKALSAVTVEMTEMKKSFADAPMKEKVELKKDDDDIDVPEVNAAASAPKSKDVSHGDLGPAYTDDQMRLALNKSFFNIQPSKYHGYNKMLGKIGADRLYSELDNSNKPSERDDAVTISTYLN